MPCQEALGKWGRAIDNAGCAQAVRELGGGRVPVLERSEGNLATPNLRLGCSRNFFPKSVIKRLELFHSLPHNRSMAVSRDPIILYRRPGGNDDWHFNTGCPRHPNPKAKGVETTTPGAADRPLLLCETCKQLESRSRHGPRQLRPPLSAQTRRGGQAPALERSEGAALSSATRRVPPLGKGALSRKSGRAVWGLGKSGRAAWG